MITGSPAFEAGLDRTYIGSAERGERNISVLNLVREALMRIAGALGTTVGGIEHSHLR